MTNRLSYAIMARLIQIVWILIFGISCSGGHVVAEPASDFSPEYPKNYLIVHEGSPAAFTAARCFDFSTVEDLSSSRASQRLTAFVAERLPQLKPCHGDWPRLVIEYRAGRGVSLHHYYADPTAAYSGFAFVALQNSAKSQASAQADALAEWQYWRGGSSNLVMEQFVFDLTNLYINHIEKPVPTAPR
jgi:hypothetical protein